MSIKVMTYVWEHSHHKGSDLLTLLAIADFAHDDGTNAYPSVNALARKTRMTERNIQLVIKKLEESQELRIERNAGPHGCHLFRIPLNMCCGEKISGDEKISPAKGEKISGGVKTLQVKPASPNPSLRLKTKDKEKTKEGEIPYVLSSERTTPPLTPSVLMDWYNAETPESHQKVRTLSPARQKKAQKYLVMFPDPAFWHTVFQTITQSPFLLGLKPSNGHESFRADFDWLLNKGKDGTENCVKVFEGKYREAHGAGRANVDLRLSAKGQYNLATTEQFLQEVGYYDRPGSEGLQSLPGPTGGGL